jgi:hypothetical protein
VGYLYTSAGGKWSTREFQYIGQPLPPVLWVWGAHERIAVHRPPRGVISLD